MSEKKRKSFKEIKENQDKEKSTVENPETKEEKGLEKLKTKVAKDLEIDQSKLKDELNNNGIKYHYYLELYIKEKKDLGKLEKLQKILYKKLYHKLKFECDFRLKTGPELNAYLEGTPKMAKLKEMINNSEGTVEYLENVLNLFKMRNYAIKNIIDVVKLESGGFI